MVLDFIEILKVIFLTLSFFPFLKTGSKGARQQYP